MSDNASPDAIPELARRLRVIEEQPLEARAEAYADVQDELARRLESAPTDAMAARRP